MDVVRSSSPLAVLHQKVLKLGLEMLAVALRCHYLVGQGLKPLLKVVVALLEADRFFDEMML